MKAFIDKYKKIRKLKQLNRKYTGKYAFVGIGNHSMNNLYPVLDYLNVSLKYIVSKSEDTAAAISKNFENTTGTTDKNKVLTDNEINGIMISSIPAQHFGLVKTALEHNKNVFVEKPPCLTSKELDELIELEKKSKGKVLVGFQKRYVPLYQKIKEKNNNTSYYRLQYFTGSYPEGDPITDLFIHSLDLCPFPFW